MESQQQPYQVPDHNQLVLMQNKLILESRARGGTDWFFWIAGLSIINSVIYLMGGSISFIAGLGITQIIDGYALTLLGQGLNGNGRIVLSIIIFCVDLAIAGAFVVAGVLGRKRYRWIVIAGMILYALDGLIFVWAQSWIDLLFHAWALWGLWRGFQAINELNALEKTQSASIPMSVS